MRLLNIDDIRKEKQHLTKNLILYTYKIIRGKLLAIFLKFL